MVPNEKKVKIPRQKAFRETDFDSRLEDSFGGWVGEVSGEAQLAFVKELTNKIQWVIGSSYKKKYSAKGGPVAEYSRRVVKAIIRDHGYQI